MEHDFIAIGDIVMDAFIRLKDAHVHANLDNEKQEICMPFGTKIPYDSVEVIPAVGNSANAAVAAARLGLRSALVASLGADENGQTCLKSLESDKVGTKFISVHDGMKTNYHYVLLFGDERTILVKHEEFPRRLMDLGNPKWLYLSSLGADTLPYHDEICQYISKNSEVKLAFQPGTFQISLGFEKLKDIYKHSKIFFCNVEEAGQILGINTLGIQELLKRMRDLGPEIVVITDGPKGAYAYDGENMYYQSTYPDPKPPIDRTGAGDASASTCVAALALGLDLPTALQWGVINSMSVVQEIGAQKGLLTREKVEDYLKNAPTEFATKKLN